MLPALAEMLLADMLPVVPAGLEATVRGRIESAEGSTAHLNRMLLDGKFREQFAAILVTAPRLRERYYREVYMTRLAEIYQEHPSPRYKAAYQDVKREVQRAHAFLEGLYIAVLRGISEPWALERYGDDAIEQFDRGLEFSALVDKQAAWLDAHRAALDQGNALDRAQEQLDGIRACLTSEKARRGPKQKGELTRQRVEDQALVAFGEKTELSFRKLVGMLDERIGDSSKRRKPVRIHTHEIRRHLRDPKTVTSLCKKGKKII